MNTLIRRIDNWATFASPIPYYLAAVVLYAINWGACWALAYWTSAIWAPLPALGLVPAGAVCIGLHFMYLGSVSGQDLEAPAKAIGLFGWLMYIAGYLGIAQMSKLVFG